MSKTSSYGNQYNNRDVFDVLHENAGKAVNKLTKHGQIIAGMKNANPKKTIGQYATLQRMLRDAYQQYSQKKEGANQSFIARLENLKTKFESGEIGEAEFFVQSNAIIDKLEQFDKAVMQKVAETNASFNAVSKNIESEAQYLVEIRDRMLKKRLVYLFLVIAPIVPIPFLDIFTNSLATMFDPNLTFGQSMSNMVKSDQLGPIGKFFDLIELDKLMELFFDKTPVVSDLVGTVDNIAGSNLVYGTAQVVAPLLDSPLPYVPLAIGAGLMGITQEIEFMETKNKSYKKQKDMIEDTLDKANKSFEEVFDKTSKKAMEEQFDMLEKASKINKILDFIKANSVDSKMQDLTQKIFSDMPDLKNLAKEQNEKDILPILCSLDSKDVDKALKKILVHEELFFRKIYNEINKTPLNQNNQRFKLGIGEFSIKSLLEDYKNFQSFKENFLDILDERDLKKFKNFTRAIGIYDLCETYANKDLERISTDQDQEQYQKISKPLLTDFRKVFASEIEDKYKKEFSKHCKYDYLDFYRDDYYERVKEVYLRAFGQEISSNAKHHIIEHDLIPTTHQVGRGLNPMQLAMPTGAPNRHHLRREMSKNVPWTKKVSTKASSQPPAGGIEKMLKKLTQGDMGEGKKGDIGGGRV